VGGLKQGIEGKIFTMRLKGRRRANRGFEMTREESLGGVKGANGGCKRSKEERRILLVGRSEQEEGSRSKGANDGDCETRHAINMENA